MADEFDGPGGRRAGPVGVGTVSIGVLRSDRMECFCCGQERDASMVSASQCHDDIKVCRICVGWLNTKAGGIEVTPTMPVADMAAAVRFYETAGFDVEQYDDGFAFVHHHEQSVCNLDLADGLDTAGNHAGCYIITGDVDEWHARFAGAGLAVTPVEDMPWGMHEFTLTDPSGNHLRIGRTLSNDDDS